jgi:TolB protein
MATPPDVLSYPTPTFTPQPLSPPIPPAEVYTGSAAGLRPVRRRAVGSLWMSALLGGVIGCALFVLLALVVLLAFSALNQVPATQTFPTVVTRVVAATRTASTEQPTLLMATNTPQPETPYVNPATPLIFDGLNLPTPDALTVGGVQAQGQIVFAAERLGNVDIYLIDVATRIETRLTDNPAIDTMPYPAPDGRSIVFSSNRDGDYEIYTMSIDGSGVTALTDNSFDDLMPSYSPNGTWIVFSADTESDRYFDLYRMFPNGTSLERLFSSSERNADPRWISEDNAIYFSSGDPADASTWEIRRLDLNTGTHQWLIENTRRDRSPTQGSDGALLFETDGDGRSAIASLNAAGGETAIIYDGPGFDSQPNLSPDGRLIVFNSDVEGRDQLYLMTARGEDVQRLTTLGGFGGVWVPPI